MRAFDPTLREGSFRVGQNCQRLAGPGPDGGAGRVGQVRDRLRDPGRILGMQPGEDRQAADRPALDEDALVMQQRQKRIRDFIFISGSCGQVSQRHCQVPAHHRDGIVLQRAAGAPGGVRQTASGCWRATFSSASAAWPRMASLGFPSASTRSAKSRMFSLTSPATSFAWPSVVRSPMASHSRIVFMGINYYT